MRTTPTPFWRGSAEVAYGERRRELYELVARIPVGRACSYGLLGRSLSGPVSGVIVGKWMASCPAELPWWRVVAANGSLPVASRSPHLAHEQRERLESEGVLFDGDLVRMDAFLWVP